jgi:hypothetical protein
MQGFDLRARMVKCRGGASDLASRASERGCVADQPQQVANSGAVEYLKVLRLARWTQPRSANYSSPPTLPGRSPATTSPCAE